MKTILPAILLIALLGGANSTFYANSNRDETNAVFKTIPVKQAEWTEQGISLDIPEDFQELKAEIDSGYETEEIIGLMKRWRGFSEQSKKSGFTIMIIIREYKILPEKPFDDFLKDLMSENLAAAKAYKRKPDVYRTINGSKGIYSSWESLETNDAQISWTTYRLYKWSVQKVWVGIGGKIYEKQKMTAIINSVKLEQ